LNCSNRNLVERALAVLDEREVGDDLGDRAGVRRELGIAGSDPSYQRRERLSRLGLEIRDLGPPTNPGEANTKGGRIADDPTQVIASSHRQRRRRQPRVEDRDVGRYSERGGSIEFAANALERGRQGDTDDDRARGLTHGRRQGTLRAMSPPSPSDRVPEHVRRLGRIHHVAVVVERMESALGFWRDSLGLELDVVEDMAHDRVRIAFLPVGESKIELVEPTDDTTGVARFLAKSGEGFHHVCFEVENLAETLLRLEIDGIELIDTSPRKGAEGPVAFLHPRSCHGVLVELIEAPGGPAWAALGY
jgi:methylmalonyl-CoA/ethylmalonyl-CoA epimerase